MNLNDALAVIATFSKKSIEVLTAGDNAFVNGNKPLPADLADYIDRVCPVNGHTIEGVGHPVELLKSRDLTCQPDMYSAEEFGKWQDDWFLIAHDGGDPIIVKLSDLDENSPVYSAMQGMGFWDFSPIADSIGQFLVCACAIQHALNFPGVSQPLDDDFNLAPAAANWLFPFLRQHAGTHYDEWASVFENYI
ncbi:MAG: hypothetical protein JKY50_14475 [Oleispira sp.]|nr:hypothetical protein [Oleispira sp.]